MTDLRVQICDNEIIVTLSGTSYSVTYYKPTRSPQLLAKRLIHEDDLRVSMTSAEFLAIARRLTNDKARDLGLIV
jgi:hypothetical protein